MVVLVVAGWVEVAHAATGLTKSSTRFIFFGNFPRAVALLVVPLAGGDFHGSPVITVMFAAWAAAELIRAPFYVANELGVLPGWLKLLRYTAFVVLSPARPHGIVCSLAVQLRCLIVAQVHPPLLRLRWSRSWWSAHGVYCSKMVSKIRYSCTESPPRKPRCLWRIAQVGAPLIS